MVGSSVLEGDGDGGGVRWRQSVTAEVVWYADTRVSILSHQKKVREDSTVQPSQTVDCRVDVEPIVGQTFFLTAYRRHK